MKIVSFFFAILAIVNVFPFAFAQNEPGLGWIEGVLVTDKGEPAVSLCAGGLCNGASLSLRSATGNEISTENDSDKGGFYTFRNLRPGIYEIFIEESLQYIRGEKIRYRPQHIFGVIVEPNKRIQLNITVHEGKGLEEIGEPTVVTQKVILISDELTRLQNEIDELKKKLGVQ